MMKYINDQQFSEKVYLTRFVQMLVGNITFFFTHRKKIIQMQSNQNMPLLWKCNPNEITL